METDVILKYRREEDNWLCSECDMENSMSKAMCFACGYRRTPTDAVLRKWTEADDRPVVPPRPVAPPRPKASPPAGPPLSPPGTKLFSGPAFEEDKAVEEKRSNAGTVVAIIIGVVVLIAIIIAVFSGSTYAKYNDAMDEFDSGNYATATEMFRELPSDYKDVAYMIDESIYQDAMQYLNNEDFTTAESLFESISYHNDSAEMVKECNYREAQSLLDQGYYAEAMEAFNSLWGYSDSSSKYYEAEDWLIEGNRRLGYFSDEYELEGYWSDDLGNYVSYTTQSSGESNCSYNLPHTDGKYFKVTNGIHYHGDDSNGWVKQWIFQRIDSISTYVYNYENGTVYILSKN